MRVSISLPDGLELVLAEGPLEGGGYATRQLQKGFRLYDHGQDLSQEAVGFGVPLIKRGLGTVFPGKLALSVGQSGPTWKIESIFALNLEERLRRGASSSIRSRPVYAAKDWLAAVIRHSHLLRGSLTATSGRLRSSLGLTTVYEEGSFRADLKVNYAIQSSEGVLQVSLDASPLAGLGITEVILMNELGGTFFDRYRDSAGGWLRGSGIGTWDRVPATQASMSSSTRNVVFSVSGGDRAKLYRGREVVGSRLAWCGFGFSFAPGLGKVEYEIRIARAA